MLKVAILFILFCISSAGVCRASDDIKLKKVKYNEHKEVMQLCIPQGVDQTQEKKKPFILLIHGGAWTVGLGNRNEFKSHCKYLARHGYPTATMSYRLSPLHRYPAAYDDVVDAIEWFERHRNYQVGDYTLTSDKVLLVGHSAGGHLALLAGLKERKSSIVGIVSLAGPTDLSSDKSCKICNLEKKIFLHGEKPEVVSPINYIHQESPPVYLMHSKHDYVVDVSQSIQLAEALETLNVPVELEILEGRRHWFPFKTEQKEVIDESILEFIMERSVPFCQKHFDERKALKSKLLSST